MRRAPFLLLAVLGALVVPRPSGAQHRVPDAAPDLLRLIRSEKLTVVLPRVMRDHGIDMWIHAMGPDDPLAFELGEGPGVCVFAARGDGRIERAAFGGRRDPEIFDVVGAASDLAGFITERDPQRIALNHSDERPGFDTISETDRSLVLEALGAELGKRVVSADRLIADLLAGRGMAEVALYGRLLITSSRLIDAEFDKIVPGVTALKDLSGNVFVRDLDGHEENNTDYVIQRGDLVGILHGASMMSFAEHNGGIGYVLREGEAGPPPEIQRIWRDALAAREIFRRNIEAGPTGAETLDVLVGKLEQAGFVYIDEDRFDAGADPEKTQVHIDFHALGRLISQQDAPRISPSGWGRELKIPLYHTFALEYMIHMPVPEWGAGKHLYICLHDGAIVTERGVEFPAPPLREIRMIR